MKEANTHGGHLVRGVALGGTVKFVVAETTSISQALRDAHDAGPLGALALGRVSTAALLMSAGLKHRQQLGIQINGDGPLGEIYAVADADGAVRATVSQPRATLEGSSGGFPRLADGVGAGRMTVIRRLEENAPAYRGIIELVDGGVAKDLAHYLMTSEQIPSAVQLGERFGPDGVEVAGGFLVQALPGADDGDLEALVARVGSMPPVADLIGSDAGLDAVLFWLFDDARILARTELSMTCDCNREHFARRLCTLGSAELARLTEELEETAVECHFCRSTYIFDRQQMSALLYGARMYEQAD